MLQNGVFPFGQEFAGSFEKHLSALQHKARHERRRSGWILFSISNAEYTRRIELVRRTLAKRKLDALYLTNGTSMFYVTGYSFISTERPAALVIPEDGKITFLGPCLEKDHVPLETKFVEEVKTYLDYPGEKHPIEHFAGFLKEMGLSKKRIGIDNKSGACGIWGYRGPKLPKKLPEAKFADAIDLVPDMRVAKSTEEIELIRESCKWANLSVSLLQEYAGEGLWDAAVALKATTEATMMMKRTLGPGYQPKRNVYPVSAGFRGQIGEMSAIPHSMSTKRTIRKGDVIIAGAGADVGGYSCELERTMIVGEPSPKQKRYFEAMISAQEAAVKAFEPGIKCSEVDKAAINVFKKAGLIHLVEHHTGHGLGLEDHEPPWLDIGNQKPLCAGIILSCEPGLYEAGFGGFRHSDTILVTKEGKEQMTYYPKELEELIVK
jgi:Xaa-Pro dipeptidase